jgi:hypothetical protein
LFVEATKSTCVCVCFGRVQEVVGCEELPGVGTRLSLVVPPLVVEQDSACADGSFAAVEIGTWGAEGGLPALPPELLRRWLAMLGIAQPDALAIASSLSAARLCELGAEGLLEAMVGAGVYYAPQCVKKVVDARARWLAAAQRGERAALHADSQPVDLSLYYEWTPDQLRAHLRHVFRLEPGVQVRR